MKKMNVWLFQTGEPLPIDENEVRPMRAINLSRALVNAGHSVVLWSSQFYHQKKTKRPTSSIIHYSDLLEIRLIPSLGYKKNIGIGRIVDHGQLGYNLKKHIGQYNKLPDICFIGYPPIETAFVLTSYLRKNNVPVLLDVKDAWPKNFLEIFPDKYKSFGKLIFWPYFYMARHAFKDATGISAMAESFLTWAVNFAEREKTKFDSVFPLTTPNEKVSDNQLNEAREWWDDLDVISDKKNRIFFVGSFTRAFEFLPIKDAAKKMLADGVELEFVICGDGELSTQIRKMMSGLPNVIMPGWIDRPKIQALAERSIVAIAPYKNTEDFCMSIPNKIIDAISMGKPILTSLHGEVEYLIDKHKIGLSYRVDSKRTLYDCLKVLISDNELLNAMSRNAINLYNSKFSYEIVYGRLVKHLEEMATKNI